MPPLALLAGGAIVGAVGSGMSQAAANKGARPVFGGLNKQGVEGVSKLGANSFDFLNNMIKNPGWMPDTTGTSNPAFQALYNANKQMVSQGRANVAEKFGRMGLGTSSPGAIGAANFEEQSTADFMNVLAQYTLQAQEYASNRTLTAAEFGLQQFMGPAFTMQGPKGSVVGAVAGSAGQSLELMGMLRALGGLGGGKPA